LDILSPFLEPITILSGFIKSFIAVPSARNSGLLVTTYFSLFYFIETALIISDIILAVPIGTVDF
jgi:hypothetical protein